MKQLLLSAALCLVCLRLFGQGTSVFINEIHYDNAGTDTNEAIEVAGPAGTDLTGWSIVLYNGSDGAVYNTTALSGTIPAQQHGYGVVSIVFSTNGLQNGAPDGIALVDHNNTVVQFLSYEGVFTAAGGPANGQNSTDVGVGEDGSEAPGLSLQLKGSGSHYVSFSWTAPSAQSIGSVNDGQTFGSSGETPVPTMLINEIDVDQSGTDATEFIELYDGGTGNTSLDGLVVVLYNGSNDQVYHAIDLEGYSTDAAGYFVIGSAGVPEADLLGFTTNGIQNGADAVALYRGSAADFPAGTDLITENLLDAIVYDTDDADDAELLQLLNAGQPQVNENASGNGAGESLQRVPNGEGGAGNTAGYQVLSPTPGTQNMGGTELEAPVLARIHHIQGTQEASPMAGQTVTVKGVVTGDFQEGDGDFFGTDLDGFYLQEETADMDSDEATSEGIFIYTANASVSIPNVNTGDMVEITGKVTEFNGLTEITQVSSMTVAQGGEVPEPVVVTLPATQQELERYESMLVRFSQPLVISEYFNYDRYNELVLSLPLDDLDRPYVPTSYQSPGAEAAAVAEAMEQRRIILDDARSMQNPGRLYHPNGQEFTDENYFRGGDVVENTTGILGYSFGLFRVQPTTGADYIATNPRTPAPEDIHGSLKVASFNVLNYFTTLGSAGRGADNAEEFERQRDKIIAAIRAINADILGLIEIENNTEAIENLVSGLNAAMGEGTYAYINTGVIGTDAIKVALIYKPETVDPVGDYAVLDSQVDPRFIDTRNRPALAQTFREKAFGGVFTVAVNHFKSKGSGCGAGDDDPQQGNCNFTRTQAAEALVDWLAKDPTVSGDPDFMIIGDLNAYDEEGPISQIKEGADDTPGSEDDFVDLLEQYQGEFAYSYAFDGQFGYLDYALVSKSLFEQVTGATEWHINSDEPDVFDYNTNFRPTAQLALYAPTPYRASDHDPLVIGLELLPAVCASEPTLPVLKENGTPARPKILTDQGRRGAEGVVQHIRLKDFGWDHKLVVISREPIAAVPQDGRVYQAHLTFGEGDELSAGVYVVHDNRLPDSNFIISGLEAESCYHIAVFVYASGENCSPNYLSRKVAETIFRTKAEASQERNELAAGFHASSVQIFPNPASDQLKLRLPSDTAQQVEIMLSDAWGKTISLGEFDLRAGNNQLSVDISKLRLSKSLYLLSIKSMYHPYPVLKLYVE